MENRDNRLKILIERAKRAVLEDQKFTAIGMLQMIEEELQVVQDDQ